MRERQMANDLRKRMISSRMHLTIRQPLDLGNDFVQTAELQLAAFPCVSHQLLALHDSRFDLRHYLNNWPERNTCKHLTDDSPKWLCTC